jgi:hypothetical protein
VTDFVPTGMGKVKVVTRGGPELPEDRKQGSHDSLNGLGLFVVAKQDTNRLFRRSAIPVGVIDHTVNSLGQIVPRNWLIERQRTQQLDGVDNVGSHIRKSDPVHKISIRHGTMPIRIPSRRRACFPPVGERKRKGCLASLFGGILSRCLFQLSRKVTGASRNVGDQLVASKYTPVHASFTIALSHPVDVSIADAKTFLNRRSKIRTVEQTATALSARVGSPTLFRLWGLGFTPKKHYPIALSLVEIGPSSMLLDLTRDAGWYAVNFDSVDGAFLQAFNALAATLQAELSR